MGGCACACARVRVFVYVRIVIKLLENRLGVAKTILTCVLPTRLIVTHFVSLQVVTPDQLDMIVRSIAKARTYYFIVATPDIRLHSF